jgi:transposase
MGKGSQPGGLDVHAVNVVGMTVDSESGELGVHRLPGDTERVVAFCVALPGRTRVAHEAGPTGFGLARALTAAGIECVVAAPEKIERPAQDRIETDRRDAERLVRLLMIDSQFAVRVRPGSKRRWVNLVRAREDVRGDLMRPRRGMGKLLLHHDARYDGLGEYTSRHRTAPAVR